MSQQTLTQTGAFTAESKDAINENFQELYQNDAGGTLASAKILVGNGSNVATAVDMSGDATIDNAGAVSISGGVTNQKILVGVAAGYKVARGATALDGSNPTAVATGLASVVSFTATVRTTDASTGTAYVTHGAPSGANVNVYAWDKTGAASTGTETFDWVAVGT